MVVCSIMCLITSTRCMVMEGSWSYSSFPMASSSALAFEKVSFHALYPLCVVSPQSPSPSPNVLPIS